MTEKEEALSDEKLSQRIAWLRKRVSAVGMRTAWGLRREFAAAQAQARRRATGNVGKSV